MRHRTFLCIQSLFACVGTENMKRILDVIKLDVMLCWETGEYKGKSTFSLTVVDKSRLIAIKHPIISLNDLLESET